MKGYELSPEATDDFQEIWVYIANDNPAAADNAGSRQFALLDQMVKPVWMASSQYPRLLTAPHSVLLAPTFLVL
jgi:plasmid stabilization system protein ParE